MKKDSLNQILEQLNQQPYLSTQEIPKLNLYIDQILTLFSQGSAEEQTLTKAMVNNYSKEKMLRPIKGKKYSREQILQILLICRLKPVLSMGQIKSLTTSLMEEGSEEMLESILCAADVQRERSFALTEQWLSGAELPQELSDQDSAELVLELSHLSQLFASAARLLTEQQFQMKDEKGR